MRTLLSIQQHVVGIFISNRPHISNISIHIAFEFIIIPDIFVLVLDKYINLV